MVVAILALVACKAPPPAETDVPSSPPAPLPCPEVGPAVVLGVVPSPPATEISGVVAIGERLWVHNDSGDSGKIHALDRTGTPLGFITVEGSLVDLEDLAIGPGPDGEPWMFFGDIGDNLRARIDVTIYSFPVPDPDGSAISATVDKLVYEDGPRDAETLLVDTDGSIWIVSKEMDGLSGVYRATDGVLERQATLEFGQPPLGQSTLVTGGDLVREGLVLRTYLDEAYVWPRYPDQDLLTALRSEPCPIPVAQEPQGESIAWGTDGFYTISEGTEPAVNFHPILPE